MKVMSRSRRRDPSHERTGPSFAEIQLAMRRYARRVYGSDVEITTAIPTGAVGPGRGPGRGIWEAYGRYPGGRAFLVRVLHRKLFPPD